jgi:excisionase family DNA binding protein
MYLLGYTVPGIHAFMDAPVRTLGPQHRQVNHTIAMVTSIASLQGPKAGKVALLHLLLDLDIIDSKFIENEVTRMKEYLTTKEVAERLSISEQTVREWIKENKLPAVKIGRRYRITVADCDQVIS